MSEDNLRDSVGDVQISESESLPTSEVKVVEFNDKGLPVGKYAGPLGTKSGDLVRTHVPISIETWHKVPDDKKEDLWKLVTKQYKLPLYYKPQWKKGLAEPFRKHKSTLRFEYLDKYDSIDEQLRNRPEGIKAEDWAEFVRNEAKPEAKQRRIKNSASRKGLDIYHTSGRRSHANVEYIMNQKQPAGQVVTRSDVWIETHTKGDDSVADSAALKMESIKRRRAEQSDESCRDILSDPLTQEFGLDKGRTRCVGNISLRAILASAPAREQLREKIEEVTAKDETVKNLVSDMEIVKSTMVEIKGMMGRIQPGAYFPSNPIEPTSSSSTNTNRASTNNQLSGDIVYRLLDNQKQVAAHASLDLEAKSVHGVPVGDDEVKVRIIEIFLYDTALTSPCSFANTIEHVAVGGFTIWLKNRIAVKPANERI